MAKLSLTARKDIKEFEKSLEEHIKTIEGATGIKFETEFDWLALSVAAEERGYKDRAGEIMYSWYLGGLASNIVSFCKDDIQKESFVETFGSAKRITFEFYEKKSGEYGYSRTRNDNGTLVMGAPKDCFCSNVSEIGNDLSATCSGDAGLNVATRKNIKDSESARKTNLDRINAAVGLQFELEHDWLALSKVAATRGYADRIGEIIYSWYLDALASNLERLCKDEMSKEAVADACGKKTIAFVLAPAGTSGYGKCTFENGVLTAAIPPENFCGNTSELGNDIESQL